MEWIEKLDGKIIVSDSEGTIIYMNERSIRSYEKEGGRNLIGQNIMDCHNESSRKKIKEIMTTHKNNVYTIEKKGRKKIIYQSPWFKDDVFRGIIEFSLEIPFDMPHFIRE
jgi:transcriptional regulator with PAS, ATPase and Fis domain